MDDYGTLHSMAVNWECGDVNSFDSNEIIALLEGIPRGIRDAFILDYIFTHCLNPDYTTDLREEDVFTLIGMAEDRFTFSITDEQYPEESEIAVKMLDKILESKSFFSAQVLSWYANGISWNIEDTAEVFYNGEMTFYEYLTWWIMTREAITFIEYEKFQVCFCNGNIDHYIDLEKWLPYVGICEEDPLVDSLEKALLSKSRVRYDGFSALASLVSYWELTPTYIG